MSSSLADFIALGPRTFLYTPPLPRSGQLIILCTWMGAARKHIAKYATLYRCVAPSARILLIESSVSALSNAFVRRQRARDFAAAAAAVKDTLAECEHRHPRHPTQTGEGSIDDGMLSRRNRGTIPSTTHVEPQILLHIFSNGGMNSATHLLRFLRSDMDEPLALRGLIFDSCPGKGTSYWQTFDALMLSFRGTVVWRFLGALAIHCLLIFVIVYVACGNENPVSFWRRTPLEESDPARGACYLFSKEDRMINWTEVEDHAEEARRKGWRVRKVLFEGSGHCAHLAIDRGRYVEAVVRVWEGSATDGEALAIM